MPIRILLEFLGSAMEPLAASDYLVRVDYGTIVILSLREAFFMTCVRSVTSSNSRPALGIAAAFIGSRVLGVGLFNWEPRLAHSRKGRPSIE